MRKMCIVTVMHYCQLAGGTWHLAEERERKRRTTKSFELFVTELKSNFETRAEVWQNSLNPFLFGRHLFDFVRVVVDYCHLKHAYYQGSKFLAPGSRFHGAGSSSWSWAELEPSFFDLCGAGAELEPGNFERGGAGAEPEPQSPGSIGSISFWAANFFKFWAAKKHSRMQRKQKYFSLIIQTLFSLLFKALGYSRK